MWITIIFVLVVILWIYEKKWKAAYFIKRVKSKQPEHRERIYEKFKKRFSLTAGNNPSNVDKVYCIFSEKRRSYIKSQLMRLNIGVKFFKAIFPNDLTIKDYNILSCTNTDFCKISEKNTKLPVQLSFVMCLMDALKHGYKTIVVFEDDVVVNVDTHTLNESLAEFSKSPYDMFYMGYCHMSCKQDFDKTKHQYLVEVPNKKLVCNHAVALKMNNIRSLIDFIFPMMHNKDVRIKEYVQKFKRRVCVPKFSYFDQDRKTHGSDNGNYNTLNHQTCDLS